MSKLTTLFALSVALFAIVQAGDSESLKAFFQACKDGDGQKVGSLISSETLMAVNEEGKTGLLLAAEKGHCDSVVEQLLSRKETNQDARAKDGSTAVLYAVERNYMACLKHLTKPGINANVDLQRDDGWRALHFAAKSNRLQMAKILVEVGKANLETRTQKDETPLVIAAQSTANDVAFYLIEKRAQINATSSKLGERSALNFAAQKGNFELVRRLLEKGARMESGNDGTPLTLAIVNNQSDIAFFLINRGASTNALDPMTNNTLLYIAARGGLSKVIEPLLTRGGDPNWRDADGWTPLLVAAANGHCETAEVLLQKKSVEVNAVTRSNRNAFFLAAQYGHVGCLRILSDGGVDRNTKNSDGETALTFAINSPDDKVGWVREILNCGADYNVQDAAERTPLFKAAELCRTKIANYLAEHNPSIVDSSVVVRGESLLMQSAKCNLVTIVKQLIKKGADVNALSSRVQKTPLMFAAENGHIEVVKLLVAAKADINGKASYSKGTTALHLAVAYPETTKFLLENGADVEADGDGTPLCRATSGNHTMASMMLIERGANVNAFSKTTGDTPLINAARNGNMKVTDALLLRGADMNAKNNKGETAATAARAKDMKATVGLLAAKAQANK